MYKRKCEDWIETFERWLLPRSGAPLGYIRWTGLFGLASALKRNIYIPQTLLGTWECYPNMYTILVGHAGMRKTTTMDQLEELFESIPEIARTPQSASQEALFKLLSEQKDQSLAVFSGDFGFLYKGSEDKLIEFLVKAFDKNRVFDNLTISRGHEKLINPSVNLLTATTPEWIAKHFDNATLQGGFASRVVWIHENELRHHNVFFPDLNYKALNEYKQALIADLIHITTLHGEVEVSQEVMEYVDSWNRKYYRDTVPKLDKRLKGYSNRKLRHALAIAILLHISREDSLIVTMNDFERSLALLSKMEDKLLPVFQAVGKNQYILDMEDIIEFIRANEPVDRKRTLARFSHIASPDVLINLLSSLCVVFERIQHIPASDSYALTDKERTKNGN